MIAVRTLSMKLLTRITRALFYLVVIAGAIAFSLPLLWMIRTSIMPPWQVNLRPIQWIPAEFHWQTWQKMWQRAPFGRFYLNTVTFAVLSVLGTAISSSLAAYAFARIRFRGRALLFVLVLSTMMLPAQVTLIPNYLIFTKLGWVNTYLPLLAPIWLGGSAFNIFLLRQYMMTIPLEYDDAAEIDGCTTMGIYWRIILPLTMPALGAIAIMHFTWSWNNFMGPLIYLNDMNKFPISLGLQIFRTRWEVQVEQLMAGTVASVAPILAMFFVAQRHFIRGIVISGVKG